MYKNIKLFLCFGQDPQSIIGTRQWVELICFQQGDKRLRLKHTGLRLWWNSMLFFGRCCPSYLCISSFALSEFSCNVRNLLWSLNRKIAFTALTQARDSVIAFSLWSWQSSLSKTSAHQLICLLVLHTTPPEN